MLPTVALTSSPTRNGFEHTKSNREECEPEQPPKHVHPEEVVSVIKVEHVLSPGASVAEEGRGQTVVQPAVSEARSPQLQTL